MIIAKHTCANNNLVANNSCLLKSTEKSNPPSAVTISIELKYLL